MAVFFLPPAGHSHSGVTFCFNFMCFPRWWKPSSSFSLFLIYWSKSNKLMYYHLQLVAAAARSASHRPITSRRTDGNLCLSGGRQQVGQQCIPATREDDHIPVFISKRAGSRQGAGISTSARCLHNHFWSAVPSVGAPSAASGPAEDKEMVWGLIPLWDAVLVELQHSEVRL